MKRFTHRRLRKQRVRRGAAAVEFALVAPLFFFLVLGMIEYGRMIMVQQMMTNASREGARYAVMDAATSTSVNSVVDSYLSKGGISGATTTITPSNPASAAAGAAVTVKVSIPFKEVSWLPGTFYLGNTTLNAETAMCRETSQ